MYVNELGDGNDITLFDDANDTRDVGPGESIYFDCSKTFASPGSTTLQVTWGDPATGERSQWRRTLPQGQCGDARRLCLLVIHRSRETAIVCCSTTH